MSRLKNILGYTTEATVTESDALYWVEPHHYQALDTAWTHFKQLAKQTKPAANLDRQAMRTAKNEIDGMLTKVNELDAKIETLGNEAT